MGVSAMVLWVQTSLVSVVIILQNIETSLGCQPTTTIYPGPQPTQPATAPPAPSPATQPPPAPSPPTSAPTNPPTQKPSTTVVKTTTTTKITTTTKAPTTTMKPVAQECTTNTGKSCVFPFLDTCISVKSEKCIFPFYYKGVKYDSCTLYHATGGKPWCATVTDSQGSMKKWGFCFDRTCQGTPSTPKEQYGCVDYQGSSWCATAVGGDDLVRNWDYCKECKEQTTTVPPTTAPPTTTTVAVTGQVTVETVTTTIPSGPKSAEMGCGCNCGCKIPTEYVMAIVSGDIGALTEMAEGQAPMVGRSLKKRKKNKRPKPADLVKGSVSDLTNALGQAGLQLPVECGCDCSCDVEDVGPLVPPTSSPPGG